MNINKIAKLYNLILKAKGLVDSKEVKISKKPEKANFSPKVLASILEKLNIHIIPSGESQIGYLGSGASADTYEIDYKGSRKVLKYFFDTGESKELYNILRRYIDSKQYIEIVNSNIFKDNLDNFVFNLVESYTYDEQHAIDLLSIILEEYGIIDENISKIIIKELEEYYRSTKPSMENIFPVYSTRPATLTDPKLASLYNALVWLKDNNIMIWGDVHSDNVMIRPSTGDYVVADLGAFVIS